MRDLAFIGFLAALLTLGLKRQFLSRSYNLRRNGLPQRLSYYRLNAPAFGRDSRRRGLVFADARRASG